ncbi:TMM33 protein, partial [Polyodon spathula]|nr:TMM33 protein [Polyodon spathula]
QFLLANKLETAMWLSRLFTVYCSVLFILPLLGLQEAANFYQRALLANALTSALRLHQRLPHFQLSRAFLALALLEDSCHYLLFSLIFVNSFPVTMSIFPVFLFSLLHATTYTKKVLNVIVPYSLHFLIMDFIVLRGIFNALEMFLYPTPDLVLLKNLTLIFFDCSFVFIGQGSLIQPFIYYRFLTLRYSSRRNPYCRTLFTEMRILIEHLTMKPACPVFLRRMFLNSIALISRLAPTGA